MYPSISIIIPVYNSAHTLERCISSILYQTFTDFEVLLVNDGSLDNSLSEMKRLACLDSRIVAINKEHAGVSAARNAGLDIAHGNHICYIDADDIIDSDYLKNLYAHRDADMVVCGYWVDVYDKEDNLIRQEKHVQPEQSFIFSFKEEMKQIFESGIMHINCNKLLRRDIIEQYKLRYKPYPVNEDFIFMMEYLLHCKSLYVVEKATYHWIRVEDQQSGVESIPDNLIDIYNEAHQLLRKFFYPCMKVADEIMYYSYNLVEHKYLKSYKSGAIPLEVFEEKMHCLTANPLMGESYRAYHPKSFGELLTFWLFRLHFYKFYLFLFQNR